MFSPTIQNLINTSGKEAAMTRAAQLVNYVNNFNNKINSTNQVEKPTQKFSEVLNDTIGEAYRFREVSSNKAVFGTLVKPTTKPVTNQKEYSKQEMSALFDSLEEVEI